MKRNLILQVCISVILLAVVCPGLWAEGQFRNIAALKFHYYSDDRYGAVWEEVFITPLPKSLFLVTAVNGENTTFSNITGGRVGIAFDLPGYFYGEAAYSLESDWDNELITHALFASTTYESGPAMASVSITGEFSEESIGGVVSPGLKYFINPELSFDTKLFLALHDYTDADTYFNFAILEIAEYRLGPQILGSLGGTFGTEYDPLYEYGRWSILGGIRVAPFTGTSVLAQFEYTNSRAHPTNPHEIYSLNFVLDVKFGKKTE